MTVGDSFSADQQIPIFATPDDPIDVRFALTVAEVEVIAETLSIVTTGGNFATTVIITGITNVSPMYLIIISPLYSPGESPSRDTITVR